MDVLIRAIDKEIVTAEEQQVVYDFCLAVGPLLHGLPEIHYQQVLDIIDANIERSFKVCVTNVLQFCRGWSVEQWPTDLRIFFKVQQ